MNAPPWNAISVTWYPAVETSVETLGDLVRVFLKSWPCGASLNELSSLKPSPCPADLWPFLSIIFNII